MSAQYFVDTFECDEDFQEVKVTEPKVDGDTIRICVRPSPYTRERGVVMRNIDEFQFQTEKNDGIAGFVVQYAIEKGGKEDGQTLVTCEPGSEICVFKTRLKREFFLLSGEIIGTGIAGLEYETKSEQDNYFGRTRDYRNRRHLRGRLRARKRYLQADDTGENKDFNFVGTYPLQLKFSVEQSFDGLDVETTDGKIWDLVITCQVRIAIFVCTFSNNVSFSTSTSSSRNAFRGKIRNRWWSFGSFFLYVPLYHVLLYSTILPRRETEQICRWEISKRRYHKAISILL
jgi:hypothetical protein